MLRRRSLFRREREILTDHLGQEVCKARLRHPAKLFPSFRRTSYQGDLLGGSENCGSTRT